MAKDTYEVAPFDKDELPFWARRKLRRVLRAGKNGLLAYCRIPGGTRTLLHERVIVIREGDRTLFWHGPGGLQAPKFIPLAPGKHRIIFSVVSTSGEVVFDREIELDPRSVLVAGCRTAWSRNPFAKNLRPNRWHIGVVRSDPPADH